MQKPDSIFQAIKWDEIAKLPTDAVLPYEKLNPPTKESIKSMLDQVSLLFFFGNTRHSFQCYTV
jgi:hypothetical protein